MSDRRTFEPDPMRDAVLTDAMLRGVYEVAAMRLGFTPDEALVYYPAWMAKRPRSYREKVAAIMEKKP